MGKIMNHAMVDIESMGNHSMCAVIQIGVCYFDPMTGEIGYTCNWNVSLQSELDEGFGVTSHTIKWWMKQKPEAQRFFLDNEGIETRNVFMSLRGFLDPAKHIWSHATFDFVIIQHHLEKFNLQPLNFRSARDIRTIFHLANYKPDRSKMTGVHHNALDDAIFQAKCVSEAYKKIIEKGA